MTTQPDALRLAASAHLGYRVGWQREAAAELRRLHAHRDALLEALKWIAAELQAHGRQHWPEAVKARAAIKAAEENT